jgi:hypothetical protein
MSEKKVFEIVVRCEGRQRVVCSLRLPGPPPEELGRELLDFCDRWQSGSFDPRNSRTTEDAPPPSRHSGVFSQEDLPSV